MLDVVLLILIGLMAFFAGRTDGRTDGANTVRMEMQAQAIEHGCASHDPQTGAWGWKQ